MRSSALPRIPAHLPVLAVLAGLFASPAAGSAPPESCHHRALLRGTHRPSARPRVRADAGRGPLGPGLGRDVEVLLGDLGRPGRARPRPRLPPPHRPRRRRHHEEPLGAGRDHRRDARAERRQGKALRPGVDRHRGNRHRPRRIPRFDGSDRPHGHPGGDRRARSGRPPAPRASAAAPVSLRHRTAASATTSASKASPRPATAGTSSPASRTLSPRMARSPASASRAPRESSGSTSRRRALPPSSSTSWTPFRPPRADKGAFSVNGLSDLLPLDENRLLVLERQFVEGAGNAAHIYEVSLEGASDVSALDSPRGRRLSSRRRRRFSST